MCLRLACLHATLCVYVCVCFVHGCVCVRMSMPRMCHVLYCVMFVCGVQTRPTYNLQLAPNVYSVCCFMRGGTFVGAVIVRVHVCV